MSGTTITNGTITTTSYPRQLSDGNGQNGGPGSVFGQSSSDKISFFGATPVTQPNTTGETTGFTANTSANVVCNESTFTGNIGTSAYTISDIVKALKDIGALAM